MRFSLTREFLIPAVLIPMVLLATACSSGGLPNTTANSSSLTPRGIIQNPAAALIFEQSTAGSGPYHIATWANDNYWAAGSLASSAQVARLVSYAESGLGNDKALNDCSAHPGTCKSVYYFNPNRVFSSTRCPISPSDHIIKAASENWFVHWAGHSDTAHRVYYNYQQSCNGASITIPVWGTNDGTTGLQSWWRSELQSNADGYNVFFMDNTHARLMNEFYACLPYPSICTLTQEVSDDTALRAGHTRFVNSINHRNGQPMEFAFNSMDFDGQSVSVDETLFNASSRFIAGVCEGCAVTNGDLVPDNYPRILDTMAATNRTQGAFVLHSTDSAGAGSSTQISERLVTTALVWLGYSTGHTVAWADLEDATKNLSIWPEDLIYPSGAKQTMVSGASDLQVEPQTWRREFTTCYQASTGIGRCAAIVNGSTRSWHIPSSWFKQSYGHVIMLSGGDVLSGGTANIKAETFRPGVTVVPAYEALLLAQ